MKVVRHLLTSVAPLTLAFAGASAAVADTAANNAASGVRLEAAYGDIFPFYGDIFPFSGEAKASYGDIFPFYGDIFPFSGEAKASYGDIFPFYGDIFPFAGGAKASYGDIFPFYGDIFPFAGEAKASYGDIFPFYGDIFPFAGEAKASYGDIFPFYGDIFPFAGGAKASYGDIFPFAGNAAASYGDIFPFYGDIFPFAGQAAASYGDIFPFYGDIFPFEGASQAAYGDIFPFYGDIFPFYGDIFPFEGAGQAAYGDIFPFYGDIFPFEAATAAELAGGLQFAGFVLQSQYFWNSAVATQSGQSFWDGFASDVFARYGLDQNDPTAFTRLSQLDQFRFMLDWRDGLMQFSGRDQTDYWMGLTGWSPALSRAVSYDSDTVIGVVDFQIADLTDLGGRLVMSGGYDLDLNSHGAAVAGLLAATHDGVGAMGIAPGASIAAYNPFDATRSAGWTDIRLGMEAVLGAGASVVNMSLGVPDYAFHTEWASVYATQSLQDLAANAVFVHAAGNQGVAQTQNIDWTDAAGANLIVVGSIGPTGQISSFSNTPGSACFTVAGVCNAGDELMNRYLVAPGEWILVSDGNGGVERRSGTSYAAPMVAGAAALLQDRWGWLKQHPGETVNILLETATDLGAPGVDEVYGRGLLNIAASQSPLDVMKLYQLRAGANGGFERTSLAFAMPGTQRAWDASGASLSVYEDVGSTFRDFSLPLGATLTGTRLRLSDDSEALQAFVFDNFTNGFAGTGSSSRHVGNPYGWDMSMTIAPLPYGEARKPDDLPFATEVALTGPTGMRVLAGRGHGAMALNSGTSAASGRLDPASGGVNPLLGLASGGGYTKAEIPLGVGRLDVGMTQRTFDAVFYLPFSNEELRVYDGLKSYQAAAANIAWTQPVGDSLRLAAGYTYLREEQGLLGVQSLAPGSFSGATETDALTLSAEWAATDRIRFGGSLTTGRTRPQDAGAYGLSVGADGVATSAFEASMDVRGVLGRNDRVRFAVLQPLHLETGDIAYTGVSVTDRSLGLLGAMTQTAAIDGRARKLAFEAYYGAPVMGDRAEIAGFVRTEAETAEGAGGNATHMVGGQFRLNF